MLVVAPQSIRLDIPALGRYVEEHKVERVHLPGVVLQKLAEEFSGNPTALSHVREFMVGGEQLQISRPMSALFSQLARGSAPDTPGSQETEVRSQKIGGQREQNSRFSQHNGLRGCRLYNQYGPTECFVMTSFLLPGNPDTWPPLPPLGKPIINTELYILDSHLQPVPVGVPGELFISGTCLAHGYLKRPDLTAERFIPNPFSARPGSRMYKTGDLVRYLAGGDVEFLGRNDFQVKIRGMRVELGEIEVELKRHPAVREAAVILAKEGVESRLVAYLAFQPEQTLSSRQMREFLHERLPEHMLPSSFVVLDTFPLTPSGKIDRRALPAPGKNQELSEGYVAPRTELEEVLAGIFSEVLRVERIGVFDNFFSLGGHSLLATQISSRVRECLHAELSVRKIFEEPTISGLARLLVESETEPGRVERNAKLLLQIAGEPEEE
jgi:acyl-CoA synthetase (AMP-forming)/AMP-acid ligase II